MCWYTSVENKHEKLRDLSAVAGLWSCCGPVKGRSFNFCLPEPQRLALKPSCKSEGEFKSLAFAWQNLKGHSLKQVLQSQ